MTPQQKEWIDTASYEELLRLWRCEPTGSPWFKGECGEYYSIMIKKRREEVGNTEHIRASKSIGW